jgi:hypothetical protein
MLNVCYDMIHLDKKWRKKREKGFKLHNLNSFYLPKKELSQFRHKIHIHILAFKGL